MEQVTTATKNQLSETSSKDTGANSTMTGISTMERQPSLLKDIHNGKELWKIAVKVKDKWNIASRDGKQSFEIVVVDCKV
ncbi:hypothetical protein L195_g055434 [Trifolium pratense]|uniref:Uncharacterized protein n=1 Tax=Trifolium pratense TaxID=57577 RepID=A0A2K3KLE1_TRIPR|nr:hypothetical protein L195_g055434 [Trifolium pratense]